MCMACGCMDMHEHEARTLPCATPWLPAEIGGHEAPRYAASPVLCEW